MGRDGTVGTMRMKDDDGEYEKFIADDAGTPFVTAFGLGFMLSAFHISYVGLLFINMILRNGPTKPNGKVSCFFGCLFF